MQAASAPCSKRLRSEASEADIGLGATMLSIVSPTSTYRVVGTIKNYYSDFIVRELQFVSGEPTSLNSTKVPPAAASVKTQPPKLNENGTRSQLDVEAVKTAFAEAGVAAADVDALCASCTAQINGEAFAPVTSSAITDKAARSAVHNAVKRVMGSDFESSTLDGGAVLIQVAAAQQRGARKSGKAGSQRQATGWHSTWPEGKPEFLHFTLYKENIDTMSALRMLAQKMCISQRRLSFAGTKDKRAITLQRISCRHLEAEKVAGLNGTAWGRNGFALVADFTYEAYGLTLGRSQGNRFTIVVRDVDGAQSATVDIATVSRLLSTHGFVNYFGPQRFGTTSVLTSDVGRCILNRDYRGAISLLFKSKAEVCPDFAPTLDAFEGLPSPHNVAKAFELCPHFCGDERDILQVLAASPNNVESAILTLPRNMLMLYCHAVQSLVWNTIVTRRIVACPRVVEGDLVLTATAVAAAVTDDAENGVMAIEGDVPVTDAAVHRVTASEVDAGVFQLHDVVLPVPGPDAAIQYPTHEACNRDTYLDVAAGLDAAALVRDEHHLAKQFHFHGTYRHVVVRPKDLELKFAHHRHRRQMLVLSDAMKLRGEGLKEDTCVGGLGDEQPKVEPSADLVALIAEFSLPPGSYATSLLREFVAFKATLNEVL